METLSWCSALRSGSGDLPSSLEDELNIWHRYHHVIQIQLVSPFIFDVPYENAVLNQWIEQVHLFPRDSSNSEEDLKARWRVVTFFVKAYSILIKFMHELPTGTQHETIRNDLRRLSNFSSVEEVLADADKKVFRRLFQKNFLKSEVFADAEKDMMWFSDLSKNFNLENERQVGVILLTCLYFITEQTPRERLNEYDLMCSKNEILCKEHHVLGNMYFKSEMLEAALAEYAKGLAVHSYSHVLYSNRAIVQLKLNNFKLAEDDASKAVFLKCDWAKGYCRLIEAICKQGDSDLAFLMSKDAMNRCRCLGLQSTDFHKLKLLSEELYNEISKKNDCETQTDSVIKPAEVEKLSDGLQRALSSLDEFVFVRDRDTSNKKTGLGEVPELVSETSDESNSDSDEFEAQPETQVPSKQPSVETPVKKRIQSSVATSECPVDPSTLGRNRSSIK